MKMKKILSFALAFIVALGAMTSVGQVVHAATLSAVTAGMTDLGHGRVPGTDDNVSTLSFLDLMPNITVTADGLVPFGSGNRISPSTTEIDIAVDGSLETVKGAGQNSAGNITSYYFDLLDRNGNSVTTPSKVVSNGFASTKVDVSTNLSFKVDLKDLKNQSPIYIAYCFTTSISGKYVNKYYSQRIGLPLSPTITTSPLTTATTTISGKGDNAGDTITNNITGDTTTVGSDKTWSFTVAKDALKGKSSITVRETNDYGDTGTIYGPITTPKVTIDSDKDSLDLSSDDVTKLEAMSDSDFVDWVKTQANIVGKTSAGSSDGVSIKTDTTGLADALKKVADNGSMPIDFYATDGTNKSATKTITLVKPGTVKFGTVSDSINFGTHGVPTATSVFGPTAAWNVNINDTRASGSKWYLYASGTKMTSGTHTMPGYMMYRDANNQTSDLTKSTLIDSGTRGTDANTAVTTNWTTDPKDTSKAGIFLDVEPGVYADSSTDYTGTVNWSLQDTPAQ